MIKFPYHIIDGAAGEYAKLYNSYLEPPLEFFYMSYLTCLGSAVANKLTVEGELSPQPRLYTLLLGESADDRKSAAIKFTVKVFEGYINICNGVGSAEGLCKQLNNNSRTLLRLDEFKQLINKCSIQSSNLLPCISTLYEDNSYANITKHEELCVEDGYLSILAASTIDTYERTWEPQFTDIGFNNRLFLVTGESIRKHFRPRRIPSELKVKVVKRIHTLVDMVKDGLEYDYTKDADDLMQTWYMNRDKSIHDKRIDVYGSRLTCLLALNEKKGIVDLDIANKTIQLMDWQLEIRKLYDPIDADNEIAKMETKIRRQLKSKGEMSVRDLKRFCHSDRSGLYNFTTALKNLKMANEITKSISGKYIINLELGGK